MLSGVVADSDSHAAEREAPDPVGALPLGVVPAVYST